MRLFLVMLAATTGCAFDGVDLRGKRCPCAVGWVCDEAINRCVEEPPRDGGFDADPPAEDAGPDDGGLGARDGGTDAGSPPEDGGLDAGPDEDGGRDGGADGGGPDPTDTTSCDDVHAGAVFCNGYEASDRDAWDETYSSLVSDGWYSWSEAPYPVYRGESAWHSRVSTPAGRATARTNALAGISSTHWYVRAYVYIPRAAGAPTINGIDILHLEENGGHQFVQLGLGGDQTQLYSDVPDPDQVVYGNPFPRNRWVCVEMHVEVGDPGVAEFWIDGALEGHRADFRTRGSGAYSTLLAGINYNHVSETEEIDVYLDELVVDTSRIGCD